jgi:hypothetical protein
MAGDGPPNIAPQLFRHSGIDAQAAAIGHGLRQLRAIERARSHSPAVQYLLICSS